MSEARMLGNVGAHNTTRARRPQFLRGAYLVLTRAYCRRARRSGSPFPTPCGTTSTQKLARRFEPRTC